MDLSEVEALYRRYGPSILRRARTLLRNEASARDALQEVFVRLLRSEPDFRGQPSPLHWLYRVTTNHCLNHLRDGARRSELLETRTHPPDVPFGEALEARVAALELLARLDPLQAEIAVYYHIDQMSHEEIAGVLGVSRRTVGNRLQEITTRMRAADPALEVRHEHG
jgi:RNA polymerase sigma-70 factor (ECF subfamily)